MSMFMDSPEEKWDCGDSCRWPFIRNDTGGCDHTIGFVFEKPYTIVQVIWGILSVGAFIYTLQHIILRLSDRRGLFSLARRVQKQVHLACFLCECMFLSMIADPFGWYNIIPIDANIIFTDAILAMELTMVILVIVSWIRLVDKVGVFRRALSNKQDENQSASVHDQFGSHGKQGSIPYLWVAYVAIGVLWVIVIVGSVLETHYKLGWQSDLLKLLAYNVIGTTILFVGWFYGLTIYYFIRKIHGMHVETIKSSADFQYRNSILTDSDSWAVEKKSTKSSMALATVPERKVTLNSELNTPLLQASESTMQGVPTTREGRLLRNQQLRIARAEHVSRQRELKLQSIIKFMGFGSVCNVIFFGITSEKMLYDFDYQWTDFVECAPPEPTTIFSSCFIYVLEWLVLIGFLYAFREPIKPRRRRRPRGRKQIQRERKPKPGQKPRRARTNPALQRR